MCAGIKIDPSNPLTGQVPSLVGNVVARSEIQGSGCIVGYPEVGSPTAGPRLSSGIQRLGPVGANV
jgi:hypothetical protein